MSLSLYEVTVPTLIRGLNVLSDYVDAAAKFAADKGVEPASVITARLAPDMMTFAGQIQRASDTSKGAIARLTALQVPSFGDTETTFPELKERIEKTVAFLKTVRPEDMADSVKRNVEMKFPAISGVFSGAAFVLQFVLPNFFFHVATAHDILRHNAVQVGKKDYLGKTA